MGTVALIFAAIICWLRLDFSITRDAKWLAAQRKERASAALQRILLLITGASPGYLRFHKLLLRYRRGLSRGTKRRVGAVSGNRVLP